MMAEAMVCRAQAAGEKFRQHLTALIEKQGDDCPAEQLLKTLDEIFDRRAQSQPNGSIVVRDHLPDGTFEEYVLAGRDDR